MNLIMLSYNTFLPDQPNGLIQKNLYVIQNETPPVPAVQKASLWLGGSKPSREPDAMTEQQSPSIAHWDQLRKILRHARVDYIVTNIGDDGSESTLAFLAESKVPAEKTIFVRCGHHSDLKRRLLTKYDFGEARNIFCECEGVRTMKEIIVPFIANGTFIIK